jgi:hypothetical protein
MSKINISDLSKIKDKSSHYQKKFLEKQKYLNNYKIALMAVNNFIQTHPDVNIDCVIDCLKSSTFSSTKCAEKLGISPVAFLRLRKKYNIEPIRILKNNYESGGVKHFASYVSKKATRNYYNEIQLKRIPQSEIDLVQIRAGRALKINGKVEWKPRGRESNGKLKPQVEALHKHNIYPHFDPKQDKYIIYIHNKNNFALKETKVLTKQEVDKLNNKYKNLEAFF